ncbi:MAG: hypothetical protein VB025_08480 [Sphaerochaeta sp.]|nr:hypothetical protein [Sphaerochaeta sp.]
MRKSTEFGSNGITIRKNVKVVVCILLLAIIAGITPLFAESQLSVPLGHRVYDVLDAAELRGLTPRLSSVRPYSTSTILDLLRNLAIKPLRPQELEEVEFLIVEFTRDTSSTESFHDMLGTGSYHSYLDEYDIYMEVGGKVETQTTLSLNKSGQADFRNAVRQFIRADIKDIVSFSMDVGIRLDKLDNRVFLDNDFTIPGEGFYMDFLAGGSGSDSIPFDQFFAGFDLHPEISVSLLDGMFEMRWGSVKRDWGVGTNNLQLASSASPFEGIEGHLNLTSWLRYSFITGSLGGFALKNGIEGNDAFFEQTLHSNKFNNNFSAKRIEVDLPGNLTFGIYESCIWIKRFEIGYLNPFTILMLQQSLLGDTDNMLAGIDFQWRMPGLLRVYGAWATTEMHEISPSKFFTHFRNIMGFQGGVDMDLPIGKFSKITFQYTKLEPFFYTHYALNEDDDDTRIETSYVNKGFSLGYPLSPNSDEFLVSTRVGVTKTLSAFVTMKYQRRSAQYGYAIDMSVNEKYRDMDDLEPKDFLGNLFEKNLSIEIGASKKFEQFPFSMYGAYRFGATVDKDLNRSTEFAHYPEGSWSNPSYDHVIQLGFNLYN